MTNEEAIKILREYIECKGSDVYVTTEDIECFELAIKALAVEPVKQCKFCKHLGDIYYCSDCHSDYSLFEYSE